MFGIWGHPKAAEITYYGLHALQHRGQDGAGIAITDGERLRVHKDIGLVNAVFDKANFDNLKGHAAIRHVLNATHDDGIFDNVQPFVFRSLEESLAIAHNGTIMNAEKIRRNLEDTGSIFQTTPDSEVLAHL